MTDDPSRTHDDSIASLRCARPMPHDAHEWRCQTSDDSPRVDTMHCPGRTHDDTVASLRKLLAEATPLPWMMRVVGKHGYPQRIYANDDGLTLVAETLTDPDVPPFNAMLIEAAVNALPDLLRIDDALVVEKDDHALTTAAMGETQRERDAALSRIEKLEGVAEAAQDALAWLSVPWDHEDDEDAEEMTKTADALRAALAGLGEE